MLDNLRRKLAAWIAPKRDANSDTATTTGIVQFFNEKRGFGFVRSDDGADYFVHATACADSSALQVGARVMFTPRHDGPKGPKATCVRTLS